LRALLVLACLFMTCGSIELPPGVLNTSHCPANMSHIPHPIPALTCRPGSDCCASRFWGVNTCATGSACNVCAECCHDELKPTNLCNACVAKSCTPGSYGTWGCTNRSGATSGVHTLCCPPGRPAKASTTLPNCLLVGDSVTNGLFPVVAKELARWV
jgi:hypothetical protein